MNYVTTKNVFLGGEIRPKGTVITIDNEEIAQPLIERGSIKPADQDDTTAPVETVQTAEPTADQVQKDFQDTGAITLPSDPLQ